MSDVKVLTQVQDDVLAKLLSEAALATVNILGQRKLLTSRQLAISLAWETLRGGKFGTGIVVGMPFIEDDVKETGVADSTLVLPIYVFEHPDSAQTTSTGSRFTAEELGIRVRKLLRGFVLDGVCSFFTEGRSIVSAAPPEDNTDVICYEVNLKGRLRSPAEVRVAVPVLTEAALSVTLTQASADAIYYTKDESFPGSGNVVTQGSNLVPGGAVYNGSGNYAVTVTNGRRYIVLDAFGTATVVIASGSTLTVTGTATEAVTQTVYLAAAQIYSAPFTVTSGTVVRAAAYKSGISGSHVIQRTIT